LSLSKENPASRAEEKGVFDLLAADVPEGKRGGEGTGPRIRKKVKVKQRVRERNGL